MRALLDWIRTQGRKARVILTAAPTWLASAGAAVAYFNTEIVGFLPAAWQGDATELAVAALAVIAAATRIVRRVTPVTHPERGVLPQPQPEPIPEI